MKKICFVITLLLAVASVFAQEEPSAAKPWKFDGVIGLNAAATGFVNWSAGGNNNANALAYAKLHLLYEKDKLAWETNFDTDFGITWIDQKDDQLQKSSDNIKFVSGTLIERDGEEAERVQFKSVLGLGIGYSF